MSQAGKWTYQSGNLTGLCIGIKPVKKTDAIVWVLSTEGVHDFFVKHYFSPNSQSKILLDLGIFINITYKVSDTLHFVSDIKLITPFKFNSYSDFLVMNVLFELSIQFRQLITKPYFFEMLKMLIEDCQYGIARYDHILKYQLVLLKLEGRISTTFDCCVCQKTLLNNATIVAPRYRLELSHLQCSLYPKNESISYDSAMATTLHTLLNSDTALNLNKTDAFYKKFQSHLCTLFQDDLYSPVLKTLLKELNTAT